MGGGGQFVADIFGLEDVSKLCEPGDRKKSKGEKEN